MRVGFGMGWEWVLGWRWRVGSGVGMESTVWYGDRIGMGRRVGFGMGMEVGFVGPGWSRVVLPLLTSLSLRAGW